MVYDSLHTGFSRSVDFRQIKVKQLPSAVGPDRNFSKSVPWSILMVDVR